MATNELAAKLQRRNEMIERAELLQLQRQQQESDGTVSPIDVDNQATTGLIESRITWHPYSEFKEFSRKQQQHYKKMFNRFISNLLLIAL